MRVILLIVGVVFVLFLVLLFSPSSQPNPMSITTTANSRSVQADAYDRVRVGMSYAQVVQILGAGPAREVMRTKVTVIVNPAVAVPGAIAFFEWEVAGRGKKKLGFYNGELTHKDP